MPKAGESFYDQMTIADPGEQISEAKTPMEFYKCLLCDKRMLWVHKSIQQHMKKRHNKTIVSYTMDNVTKIMQQVTLANTTKIKKNKEKKPTEEKIKKKKKKARWYDGCEYLCSICNKIFKQKPYLSNHLITMHQLTYDEYRIKHNVQEKIREYECKICNKLVLWNIQS